MTSELQEEIEKLIHKTIKENLKIYIEASGPHIRCELYDLGNLISSKTTKVNIAKS